MRRKSPGSHKSRTIRSIAAHLVTLLSELQGQGQVRRICVEGCSLHCHLQRFKERTKSQVMHYRPSCAQQGPNVNLSKLGIRAWLAELPTLDEPSDPPFALVECCKGSARQQPAAAAGAGMG